MHHLTPSQQKLAVERRSRLARFSVGTIESDSRPLWDEPLYSPPKIKPPKPKKVAKLKPRVEVCDLPEESDRPLSMDEMFALAWRMLGDAIEVRDIQEAVCRHFNCPMDYMYSRRRDAKCVLPRKIAMYLSQELAGLHVTEIAPIFRRDRTTIMQQINSVQGLIECGRAKDVQIITAKLRGTTHD